jgi:hypothetical protein
MMLLDIYIDTIEDVLDMRAAAIAQLKAGGTVLTSWSSENSSATKTVGASLSLIMRETKEYLQLKDPDLYGSNIRRTSPTYLY